MFQYHCHEDHCSLCRVNRDMVGNIALLHGKSMSFETLMVILLQSFDPSAFHTRFDGKLNSNFFYLLYFRNFNNFCLC